MAVLPYGTQQDTLSEPNLIPHVTHTVPSTYQNYRDTLSEPATGATCHAPLLKC